MGKIGSDERSMVINMIAKNTEISQAIRTAVYVRTDESQIAIAQSVQQVKLVKVALQTEHEESHAVDDKRAWMASSLSSAVLTPPSFKSNENNFYNQPAGESCHSGSKKKCMVYLWLQVGDICQEP